MTLSFQTCPELFRVGQYRVDGPELFLHSGLCTSFRHVFASVPLALSVEFIHLTLGQFQYRPKTFIINDLSLINAFQLIENLISERTVAIFECQCAIRIVINSYIFTSNPGVFFRRFNKIYHFVIAESQRFRQLTRFLPGKDIIQILGAFCHRSVMQSVS